MSVIRINMTKARNIWRDVLRQQRVPRFAEADLLFQRAVEDDDAEAKARAIAIKQALRDVTQHPSIEAAVSTDRLAALWLDVLVPPAQSGKGEAR